MQEIARPSRVAAVKRVDSDLSVTRGLSRTTKNSCPATARQLSMIAPAGQNLQP
jgi:hypothetical protein